MSVSSPINIEVLKSELVNHPDKEFVHYLLHGIQFGFDTGIKDPPTHTYECKNLLSARTQPDYVTHAIQEEVENGYMLGPFDKLPFSHYRVSPIGVAQHKYSSKRRLTLDLSSPHDNPEVSSINQHIDKSDWSLKYVRVDDAIEIIKTLGKCTQLIKVDVKNAFRNLPISPSQWRFHCVKWFDAYYVYVRLAFGSRSSCKIFTTLSQAIHWVAVNNYDIPNFLFLLDDFLVLDKSTADAESTKAKLLSIFDKLGVPLNEQKTQGSCTSLIYLGVGLDTVAFKAFLPQEKMLRIKDILQTCIRLKAITKRHLLSVLGHCSFAARVVVHARPFLATMIKLSTTTKQLHHFVTLNKESKEDIFMFLYLLKCWNGVFFSS